MDHTTKSLVFIRTGRENGAMSSELDYDHLQQAGKRHLWMHFSRHGAYDDAHDIPIITKGDGMYIWDAQGRKYLDGLAGLFVVQAGHGREELAEAAAKQAAELSFFPIWTFAHPNAIML